MKPRLFCHPGGPGFDGSELRDLGGLDVTRELVLIDPRGTKSPADSYQLSDYVADLQELVGDDTGVGSTEPDRSGGAGLAGPGAGTVDLLGFSHGGLVAAAFAIEHPKRVRKLVLASALAVFTPEMQEEANRVIASKAGEPWHAGAVAALAREERGDYDTPEEMAAMWNDMAPLYFWRWDERYRPLVEVQALPVEPLKTFNESTFDLRPELGRIEAETLAITGVDDFICGPAAAQVFADGIPRCEVVLLENAGHFTFLEQPEAFVAAVEGFLAR